MRWREHLRSVWREFDAPLGERARLPLTERDDFAPPETIFASKLHAGVWGVRTTIADHPILVYGSVLVIVGYIAFAVVRAIVGAFA